MQKSIIVICDDYYNNNLSVSDMLFIIWCGEKFCQENKLPREDLNIFGENIIVLGIE